MSAPLLEVADLYVQFQGRRRLFRRPPPPVRAVNGVSFAIERGTTFGLVGESGSGKSTVARAILQLVPPTSGAIRLDGEDVTAVPPKRRLVFRRRVQAVLQNPYSALNQAHDAATIVGDAITRHRGIGKGARRDQLVIELLEHVGLSREFLRRYPYEMSGGQCQRVSIARALAVQPELVVADEVTSALDVSVQSQVVNLLSRIQREDHVALLFIAHNLEIVRYMSDRTGVMYLGYLVESGDADGVYTGPTHPYTEMLIASNPVPDPVAQASRRAVRKSFHRDAEPPSPAHLPPGCPFVNRCPGAMDVCSVEMPAPTPAHHGGFTRCHLHTHGPRLAGETVVPYIRSLTGAQRAEQPAPADAPLA